MTMYKKTAVIGSAVALSLAMALPTFAKDGVGHREGPKDGPKAMLSINPQGKVVMNGAEVTAVGANTLTVKLFGTAWTVNFGADTKFVRKFGGGSGLTEISVGDRVMVRGTIVDGALAVNATHLRNDSTREAAFRGTIATVTAPDMLTVTVKEGVTRTVKVASTAKIMVGEEVKTFADLAVGMKVGVKGFVNRLSEVVTAYKINARVVAP